MAHFIKYLKYLKFLPKTLYVNTRFKCFPKLKLPFFPLIVTSRLRLYCDATARIDAGPGSYLRLGYGSGGVAAFEHTGINLEFYDAAVLSLDGVSIIGYGSSICVHSNALLHIGSGTYLAGNTLIKCAKSIIIGKDCAISWNVTLMDSDFHPWSINGEIREMSQAIIIEDHVWIGNNVIILKGITIGSGSIVGAGSVVTSSVPKNSMVAGNPARILHKEVAW